MNKNSRLHPARVICTFFGLGKFPIAPGTIGSIAGLVVVVLLLFLAHPIAKQLLLNPFETLLISLYSLVIILFILGLWASKIYSKITDSHDASEIIIDEVVGQMLCIAIIFSLPYIFLLSPMHMLVAFFASFILFRILDILKPFPINWIDSKCRSALGIMLDDIIAGILTAVIINCTIFLFVTFM